MALMCFIAGHPSCRHMKPFIEPVGMVFIHPLGMPFNEVWICLLWPEHAYGIHFPEDGADIFNSIMMLPITMCNKIIDQFFFCLVYSFSFPAAAGEVIHKIGDELFGRCVHEFAEQEELVGQYEF